MGRLPEILVADQSGREHALDLDWLKRLGQCALPRVGTRALAESVIPELEQIEITLVDDATIARIHGEFMDLPDPTDIITFHHGEMLISVDTAQRQGQDYGRNLRDEVALYIVHGLLHLAGYEDKAPEAFQRMARTQEEILTACLAVMDSPGPS